MALLHRAELRPSKLELLTGWLPGRGWLPAASTGAVTRVASCRLDDPAGEVGVEILVVRIGDGPALHVPLTYRGAPLGGAEDHLVGTAAHTVLGRRWVYDVCADPVYASTLAAAVLTGGGGAEQFLDDGGRLVRREPDMTVRGSGTAPAGPRLRGVTRVDDGDPTVVVTDRGELLVVRVPSGTAAGDADPPVLTGTWPGATGLVLAYARGFSDGSASG